MSDPTQPSAKPDFLQHDRPPVPDISLPRGIQPFHLADQPVRGRLIRLGPLADALLTRHENHPQVTKLAGEALALTAGLAGALKYRGSFSLQAKGDGPVSMLLADCTEGGALRGYARADAEALARLLARDPIGDAAALLGRGYLAFTCDQGPDMDRYQGIVEIKGLTLAAMTGHYFDTSEQLRAHVRLACDRTEAGWRASALIMERVAGEGGIAPELDAGAQEEAWRTALALAATLTDAELLDDALPSHALLHRLFHAEGLQLDRPRPLSYGCRCSRSRLAGVLASFGGNDLDHMAQEDGAITMTCEFCNLDFRFDRAEVRGSGTGG
ncbi:Hsp33 family molecular chaperone HslO [Belnapia sp. T6]|uniref:Hsp33 family molecular chaperone HslO n=1 Tax=Belnapia mucosa TaxID=2804532 RepID=A0ABS1V061_9PROT|nr:Hsp33 family molecular chaperone HslO [Belnapia mucosa]MBL6454947.1 Hsp33 family molecular chaperone HslO [Belnapia mucosa]